MDDEKPDIKGGYVKESDAEQAQVLSRVLDEHDLYKSQRNIRIELLKQLEAQGPAGKSVAYISFFCSAAASIDTNDIPAFGDVLLSVGEVDQLNLIIDSPGGEGTVAEKIIELCRAYCSEFRVIVPNRAKSAATIIALGSDEIVMGYCSELGPIDAQVLVVVGGCRDTFRRNLLLIPDPSWRSVFMNR
jgi:ClpP class serine protease